MEITHFSTEWEEGHLQVFICIHKAAPVGCSFTEFPWGQSWFAHGKQGSLQYTLLSWALLRLLEKGMSHLAVLFVFFLLQPSFSPSQLRAPQSFSYTNPYPQTAEKDSAACHLALLAACCVSIPLCPPPFLKRINLCLTGRELLSDPLHPLMSSKYVCPLTGQTDRRKLSLHQCLDLDLTALLMPLGGRMGTQPALLRCSRMRLLEKCRMWVRSHFLAT